MRDVNTTVKPAYILCVPNIERERLVYIDDI